VTVGDLPDSYELRSLTYDSTDLKVNALQLPPGNAGMVVTPSIVVTLTSRALPQPAGVRVSGWIGGNPKRSIYISGNPGATFSDGTFEFLGVSAGRHAVVALDNSGVERPLGAALVVGDRDLLNIDLEEVSILPADFDRPTAPQERGNRLPGSRSAMVSIRGRVVDGDTRAPFSAGKVMVNGNYSATFSLNDDGGFEVPRLLPGKYLLEAVVFGIGTVSREVILDEADVTLELSFRSPP